MTFSEILRVVAKALSLWVAVAPWEQCVRVRLGKNIRRLDPGFHFLLPLFDRVVVQPAAARLSNVYAQTLMTKDGDVVSVRSVVKYHLVDLALLCQNVASPEDAVIDEVASQIAALVPTLPTSDLTIRLAEEMRPNFSDWGLKVERFSITDLVVVRRAYRLISDNMTEHVWGTKLSVEVR